jgi:hypothetical protein
MPKGKVKATAVKRQKIAEAVLMGMDSPAAIGKYAGYSAGTVRNLMSQDEDIIRMIEEGRKKAFQDSLITRDKVQNIVLDAVDMARQQAMPGDMIRGAQELNKMNGFYAPERKELELGEKTRELISRFEAMSDVELLEAIEHDVDPIEAEFEVLSRV